MTEGDLLYLSACLVGHRVGQPDSVDVVPHHGDMAERRDQRAGVPAPRVQRDRADLGQPVARPGLKPAVHEGGRRVQGGWIEATIRDRAAPHPAPLP
jgi:hypothetical protein